MIGRYTPIAEPGDRLQNACAPDDLSCRYISFAHLSLAFVHRKNLPRGMGQVNNIGSCTADFLGNKRSAG